MGCSFDFYFKVYCQNGKFWATCGRLPGFTATGDTWKSMMNSIRCYMLDEHPLSSWCVADAILAGR